jgi:hypothetical protein
MQSRPLSAIADEERTHRSDRCQRSCCNSQGRRRADRLATSERLDDDHGGTAMRADERGLDVRYGELSRLQFVRGGNDVKQLARSGEMLAASGIGEQPVVANAMEAAG